MSLQNVFTILADRDIAEVHGEWTGAKWDDTYVVYTDSGQLSLFRSPTTPVASRSLLGFSRVEDKPNPNYDLWEAIDDVLSLHNFGPDAQPEMGTVASGSLLITKKYKRFLVTNVEMVEKATQVSIR